ncbi:hypothetical protein Goarm_014778, partial [Gossypium armourianum]|nr:hypothetical protein [Gossypium armourianum]
MWRPSAPIHMMDIENGYFLVKFQNKLDCKKAFFEGLWTIFGQYLTVQPWTMTFDPTQAYPSVVMAWIRFLTLPSYLYNRKIITEIRELVGKVVKLDMNTDSRTRGRCGHVENIYNFRIPDSTVEASIAPGSCSRSLAEEAVPNDVIDGEILHVEEESSAHRSTSTLKGSDRGEVVMGV